MKLSKAKKRGKSRYLGRFPKAVPAGMFLVHNPVLPTRQLGWRGFRAWVQSERAPLRVCRCGWAPELGKHYMNKEAMAAFKSVWTDKERQANARRVD